MPSLFDSLGGRRPMKAVSGIDRPENGKVSSMTMIERKPYGDAEKPPMVSRGLMLASG